MIYTKKEGTYGPIHQIAAGLFVQMTQYGTWQLVLRKGLDREKKLSGKARMSCIEPLKLPNSWRPGWA